MKDLCIGVGLGMSVSSLLVYGTIKPGRKTGKELPAAQGKAISKDVDTGNDQATYLHRKSAYSLAAKGRQ